MNVRKKNHAALVIVMRARARVYVCVYMNTRRLLCIYARATGKEKGEKTYIRTQKCVFFFFLTPLIFLPRCGARSSLVERPCHSSWRDRSGRHSTRHARIKVRYRYRTVIARWKMKENRWRNCEKEGKMTVRWERETPPKSIAIFRNLLAIFIVF